MVIYLITNTLNGKYYVGQTMRKFPEKRWKEHQQAAKRGGGAALGRAIRESGVRNFKFEVLCECPNQEALNEAEKFYIRYLAADNPSFGYNSTSGGDYNYSVTEEVRKKIGEQVRGHYERDGKKPDILFVTTRYVVAWACCNIPLSQRMFLKEKDAFKMYEAFRDKPSARIETVTLVLMSEVVMTPEKYFKENPDFDPSPEKTVV